MRGLELRFLGPPEVLVDGRPLEVDTRKAVAVLAYLSVAGSSQPRDRLVELLWPEQEPERARGALRRTLSVLRRGLGDRFVFADRATVRLDRAEMASDLDTLVDALDECGRHGHDPGLVCESCIGPLSRAAALRRGEFLDGFTIRDTPDFEEWVLRTGQHYRHVYASVAERLSFAYAAAGDYRQAVAAARRWLEIDPLHEPAHRRLMLLHAWSGDRSGAIAAYRECVAVVQRELGVDPLEETTELYEAIVDEDLPRAPAPPRKTQLAVSALAHSPARLVGRDEDLQRLVSGYELAGTSGAVMVIEGEAGIGKTRLLEEAVAALVQRGAAPLVGRAYRGEEGLPFAPFVAALGTAVEAPPVRTAITALGQEVVGELARLLPALGRPAPSLEGPAARTRFFEAMGAAIAATGRPAVLAIDNAHWMDAASVELFGFLARRRDRFNLLLITTLRPEDAPMDSSVAGLLAEAGAQTIRLSRLDRDEVAQLLEASGRTDLDVADVLSLSQGLPLFVVEYLAVPPGAAELPSGIRRLASERLGSLSSAARQVISAAAVIGHAFSLELAKAVSGRSEEEAASAVDELVARRLLRELSDGSLDFVHEQLRDIASEDTTLIRRRLLHRRTAEGLLARHPRLDPGGLALVASHFRLAGEDQAAAGAYLAAGDAARAVHAHHEAVEHYQAALALGHPNQAYLQQALGEVHTLKGSYGQALSAYRGAVALGGDTATIERRIADVHGRIGEWARAQRHLELAAEALDPNDLATRSRLGAEMALAAYRLGDLESAVALVKDALEQADQAGDRGASAQSHNLAGMLAEQPQQAIAHLRLALAAASELPDPSLRMAALNNLALALGRAGESTEAIAVAEEALAESERMGDRHRQAAVHNNLADLLHATGRKEESMAHLKRAVALFAEIGTEPGALEPEVWKLASW